MANTKNAKRSGHRAVWIQVGSQSPRVKRCLPTRFPSLPSGIFNARHPLIVDHLAKWLLAIWLKQMACEYST